MSANMIYSIRHITNFAYQPPVRESVMEVRMQPRSEGPQRCLNFYLDLSPSASIMMYRDFLGNTVHHFDIPGRQAQITITAKALVEVQPIPAPQSAELCNWSDFDTQVAKGDFWEMLLPSRYACSTETLQEFAGELHLERRSTPLETLLDLNQAIYRAFDYVPNSTKVDSPIDDALRSRRGVCQDFAHIMIALVRQLRVPCRYISGYLCHDTKVPDRSPEGATHAWVEAFLPFLGWVAFDPTNNLVASDRHIRVAIGRDYADVPPTRGVYKGEAASELSVGVFVSTVDRPLPEDLSPATVIQSRPAPTLSADRSQYEQQQQ
jgi:transglutaminase-like putative cysteine protease